MSKRLFFVRIFAVALGALLYVSCDKRDNPISPEPEPVDPMIEEITYEDVTAMVAVDKWGQAGFTGSWAAPEVDTKDGRHSGMAEVYGEGDAVINATGVLLQQTIEGLQPGKYTVDLYANAMYTPDRGFNSDMEDNAEDVAYLLPTTRKSLLLPSVQQQRRRTLSIVSKPRLAKTASWYWDLARRRVAPTGIISRLRNWPCRLSIHVR